jgi:HlyD family secretion protein
MNKFLIITAFIISLFGCKNINETADAYGNFEATATTISAETNGKLLNFQLEEGDVIEVGELIAIIDTTNLVLQRKQLEASLGTLPKKLRNSLADIAVLENNKKNVMVEQARIKKLFAKKAATQQQLDQLNGQIDVLNKQIAAVRSQTNTANTGILAEKEPILAQINIINQQIKNAYVNNPVKGTVLTKLAENYELVHAGSPLYRIGDLDTLTLRFYVDAVQLQSIKLGQKIEVLIDKGEKDYESVSGQISWIADEAEFTPKTIQTKEDRVNLVYAIKALVPNTDKQLKIGMPADVKLTRNDSKKDTK